MAFDIQKLTLNDAFVIDYFSVKDPRGNFSKCFEKDIYRNFGIEFELNETFFSSSCSNVIRGIHFQTYKPQAKIVCVPKGRVWDVLVDLRKDSTTYLNWEGIELSENNHKALYVPKGFGHAFLSLEDGTLMVYQCEGAYDKNTDTGIRFDDSVIGIKWPVDLKNTSHSDRDLSFCDYNEALKKGILDFVY